MEGPFDLPDPSDWLHTPVTQLGSVESALRCQVCKDFFNTPMITSCSHTFCSLCIRKCLTEDGICPTCRSPDQMMKLRQNWTVQEVVEAFQIARPSVLRMGTSLKEGEIGREKSKRKRKCEASDLEDEDHVQPRPGRPFTRSESASRTIEACATSNSGASYQPGKHIGWNAVADYSLYGSDDRLSACPICGQQMKEEEVFPHLDIHNDTHFGSPKPDCSRNSHSPYFHDAGKQKMKRPMNRLPQINYSLLKDNALRKKLAELGIPNTGPKALLMRRHTEWVNLVNANCDSRSPRAKRDLLHDLDVWDKTQGRQTPNGPTTNTSTIMHKDFDGAAWATSHDSDYRRLVAEARAKNKVE